MTVRMAIDSDYEQILAIWLEGVAETFRGVPVTEKILNKFQQNFEDREEWHFWVAEKDKEIIGIQTFLPATNHAMKAHLYAESSTYIKASSQGKGIVKPLYAQSIEYVINHTEVMFVVGISKTGKKSIVALYEHFGFSLVGEMDECKKAEIVIGKKVMMIKTISR